VLIIVAVFVIRYLGDQWAQIQDSPPQINWLTLLASQLGLTVGLALLPLGGWRALHDLDADLPAVTVWRIFFLSNIAKYLPGSVWALPGRAFLYQRAGVMYVADERLAASYETYAAGLTAYLCAAIEANASSR
jgi:hypothetical protein